MSYWTAGMSPPPPPQGRVGGEFGTWQLWDSLQGLTSSGRAAMYLAAWQSVSTRCNLHKWTAAHGTPREVLSQRIVFCYFHEYANCNHLLP